MKVRKIVAIAVGSVFVASACGGGGTSASETSIEPVPQSVEVTNPVLDFNVPETTPSTAPPTTDNTSLFEGFVPDEDQSEMIVELDSPNVAKVAGETVFALEAPGECKEVPIGVDVELKQIIFDLYWSCLYRPIVVTDDDFWLTLVLSGEHSREYLREKGVGSSREASCMRGGLCDSPILVDLGEGVRAECSFDSIVVPHERAGIRLQSICGNSLRYTVAAK